MERAVTDTIIPGPVRRNLPAEERRRALLDAAVDLFAGKGTGITVQELADRVMVTQPLVHRYFSTKADLIAAIHDALQSGHWDGSWQAVLADRHVPLDVRIQRFYLLYLPTVHRVEWLRGFLFAALEDCERLYRQGRDRTADIDR